MSRSVPRLSEKSSNPLRAIYVNKYRRDIRRVKVGFSWTVLFGGMFALLLRRQWKMAATSLSATFASLYMLGLLARFPMTHWIVGTAAMGAHVWMSCKANEHLLASLVRDDYVSLDDYAKIVRRTLGPAGRPDRAEAGELKAERRTGQTGDYA